MQTSNKHIPLSILHLTGYTSPNSHALSTLMYCLERSALVRAYGFCSSAEEAMRLLDEGKVNTLTIDLMYFTPSGLFPSHTNDTLAQDAHKFISTVRAKHPQAVIVIYTRQAIYEKLCRFNSKYDHYFFLSEDDIGHFSRQAADAFDVQLKVILNECENWFFKFFQYDIVISYAGEDRNYAEQLAKALKERDTKVFYDRFEHEASSALGQDLINYLTNIYSRKARLCLVLVSRAYVQKRWTMFELGIIQDRINKQPETEYLVPLRLDETELPDIPETIVYLHIKDGVEKVIELIERKLWILNSDEPKNRLTSWWW